MGEIEKLQLELDDVEEHFELVKKNYFWKKRNIAADWMQSPQKLRVAKELTDFSQVITLIESIKYSVIKKTLSSVQKMISERFSVLENGSVDTGDGVIIQPGVFKIMVARALARAYIEADRQSEYTWKMLHKMIEYHLPKQDEEIFTIMAQQAYRELLQLRSKSLSKHEHYYEVMKSNLSQLQIDRASWKSVVDGLDHLIEVAVGCSTCSTKHPSPEFFNTRPLFDDKDVVEAMESTIESDFMGEFIVFDDDPDVFHVHESDVKKVNRADINRLMELVVNRKKVMKKI